MIPLLTAILVATSPVSTDPAAVPRPGNAPQTYWGAIPAPVVVLVEPPAPPAALVGPPEALGPAAPPRPDLPAVLPFGPGERLVFSIDYGFINAGKATMEVREIRKLGGVPCLDIGTEAKSNAFFSKFYKVWDRAQTYLEVETVLPRRFEKHIREGSYRKDRVIKFDRKHSFARYQNGEEISTDIWTQDELSSFYYLRTLPLEVGRDVIIDTHADHKNYPLKVIVHARETVKVGAGTFDCWVIEPVIREGGIFSAKGTLTIWVTADEFRMPVKLRTKIVVGSITASLVEYTTGDPVRRETPPPDQS